MLSMARFIFKGQEESHHNLLETVVSDCEHLWPSQESPAPGPKFQEPPEQELENLPPSKSTVPPKVPDRSSTEKGHFPFFKLHFHSPLRAFVTFSGCTLAQIVCAVTE